MRRRTLANQPLLRTWIPDSIRIAAGERTPSAVVHAEQDACASSTSPVLTTLSSAKSGHIVAAADHIGPLSDHFVAASDAAENPA